MVVDNREVTFHAAPTQELDNVDSQSDSIAYTSKSSRKNNLVEVLLVLQLLSGEGTCTCRHPVLHITRGLYNYYFRESV